MDGDKFAELQFQMRLNQNELQDFLKGMDSWEEDIKKRDEQLKKEDNRDGKDLPPVRNSTNQKRKKKVKKVKKTEEKVTAKLKKISSYDYRSWDKFDVEKECEKIDDKSAESSSEYETDEEWEEQRRKVQANMEKDNGNQYFKEGKYNEAVECYSRGYELDPVNALLPANRAMALLKQHKYATAEQDCTAAISIDPTYVKAYSRRATARLQLKKLQEAHADFSRVLKLEPTNKQALREIQKLDQVLNPVERVLQTTQPGMVKAIYRAPNQRSKKPLRRIVIEEIGIEDNKSQTEIAVMECSQSNAKQKITARDNDDFMQYINNKQTTVTEKEQEASKSADDSQAENNKAEFKLDLSSVESTPTIASKTLKSSEIGSDGISPMTSPWVPCVPQTSFKFQTDWKQLKKHDDKFYEYIKQIDPATYPKLFGEAVDANILIRMLNTFKTFYVSKNIDIFEELKYLSCVKRFSMTVMFMSSYEKQVIRELFTYLRKTGTHESADIDQLATAYDV